jgi:hypothetical protein
MTGLYAEHAEHAETRGFTLGRAASCTYLAEVLTDVTLNPQRWDLAPPLAGADRILIGSPLWIRTTRPDQIVRYRGRGMSRRARLLRAARRVPAPTGSRRRRFG